MAKRLEGEVIPQYILWDYTANEEGKHPVKLRVTHQRKQKYYPIIHDGKKLFMDGEHYEKITETKLEELRGKNRRLRVDVLEASITKANNAIKKSTNDGRDPFIFESFEREYLGEEGGANFLKKFDAHLQGIAAKGQAGTYRCYKTVYNQFKEFLNHKDIDPSQITVEKLEKFESWLTDRGINTTSIAIRMRCLRTIYNIVSANDEYLKMKYPFSRNDYDGGYKIPAGSGGQKGVTLNQDELIDFINGEAGDIDDPMYRAKQLFLFSFFAQGMNFADMARLQYSNVGKDAIEFNRLKTIRTRNLPTKVRIPLTNELQAILIEQGNPDKRKTAYVFGLFDPSVKYTPKLMDATKQQWVKITNKWLARYCEKNGLPVVSTYAARHTFASIAKSELPLAMISKMLGHTKITTTQAYLGRFDDQENREGLMKVYGRLKKESA